jgi:hypothetical protein
MAQPASPPPYDESEQKALASLPSMAPKCALCQSKMSGTGIMCLKGALYCQKCTLNFAKCARCDELALKDNFCAMCGYTRDKCAVCATHIDDGIFRIGQILCKNCAFPNASVKRFKEAKQIPYHARLSDCCVCGFDSVCTHGEKP